MTTAPHTYTALHGEKKEGTEVLALQNSFIGVRFLFKFGEVGLIEYCIPWSIITLSCGENTFYRSLLNH